MEKPHKQLNNKQKSDWTTKFLKTYPWRSDRWIASEVGVSPTTVGTVRRKLVREGVLVTGQDGVERAQVAHRNSGGRTMVMGIIGDGFSADVTSKSYLARLARERGEQKFTAECKRHGLTEHYAQGAGCRECQRERNSSKTHPAARAIDEMEQQQWNQDTKNSNGNGSTLNQPGNQTNQESNSNELYPKLSTRLMINSLDGNITIILSIKKGSEIERLSRILGKAVWNITNNES